MSREYVQFQQINTGPVPINAECCIILNGASIIQDPSNYSCMVTQISIPFTTLKQSKVHKIIIRPINLPIKPHFSASIGRYYILADYVIDDSIQSLKSNYPSMPLNLINSPPITEINLKIEWQVREGKITPLTLAPGGIISLTVGFIKN